MHQDSSFAIKTSVIRCSLINFICANLPFKKDEKMDLLSINSLRERTYHLLEVLNREVQLAEIKASIQMRAREDIDQQQREYFLQQQIKTIQDELGGSGQEQEIEEMRLKAVKMHWNAEVRDTFLEGTGETGTYTSAITGLQRTAQLSANNAQPALGSLYNRQSEFEKCRKDVE